MKDNINNNRFSPIHERFTMDNLKNIRKKY